MESAVLREYYQKRGFSEDETAIAVLSLNECQDSLDPGTGGIEDCSVARMKEYIAHLNERQCINYPALWALARAASLAENAELYIYLVRIAEPGSIISNIKEHICNVLGNERACELFRGLPTPEASALSERTCLFTRELVDKLAASSTDAECKKALQGNAHGIPPEAFADEAEAFRKAESIASYLEEAHKRSVQSLQDHADSGRLWFEQIITQPVVDWVAANREVLGGVLEDGKIFWTKIPYDPDVWLNEKDPDRRRYLACHCPMARESLNEPGEKISGLWCNCTAGFIKQRFNAVFGFETEVELLESVLNGDDRCRFAVKVPKEL